jgi:hypothetical protein
VIERRDFGSEAAGVRIGDGSLYDWFVEEIVAAENAQEMVEELEAAMRLLKVVRQQRRFSGLTVAAFEAVARERAARRPRRRGRS